METRNVLICCCISSNRSQLSVLSDFSCDLRNIDKVIKVEDYNIHVNVESNRLNIALNNFAVNCFLHKNVQKSTHLHHHTLDLVLTNDTESELLTTFSQNPF